MYKNYQKIILNNIYDVCEGSAYVWLLQFIRTSDSDI